MQPSPFQTIAGSTEDEGPEATPVHHENVAGPLENQIREHDEALKGYMGKLSSGQTLHPDEYQDYEGRIKEKSHDTMLLERLNKQHGVLKRRGNEAMREHRDAGTRNKATDLLDKYQGGGN